MKRPELFTEDFEKNQKRYTGTNWGGFGWALFLVVATVLFALVH